MGERLSMGGKWFNISKKIQSPLYFHAQKSPDPESELTDALEFVLVGSGTISSDGSAAILFIEDGEVLQAGTFPSLADLHETYCGPGSNLCIKFPFKSNEWMDYCLYARKILDEGAALSLMPCCEWKQFKNQVDKAVYLECFMNLIDTGRISVDCPVVHEGRVHVWNRKCRRYDTYAEVSDFYWEGKR